MKMTNIPIIFDTLRSISTPPDPGAPMHLHTVTVGKKDLTAILDSHAALAEALEPFARRAPVQGFSAGIPWDMHLRAYDAYTKKHGKQQALIEGGCRGGFGPDELDQLIPNWRDEIKADFERTRQALAQTKEETK